MQEIAAVLILALSPAVGSFLGVLVDRLTVGEDVILQPSACAACGKRLGWAEMVPVVSYLVQGGRCRHCGAAIPGHLVRIELTAILAALAAVALDGGVPLMVLTAGYLWCLTALFYADLMHFRLPDPLTAALALLGLGLAWAEPGRELAGALLSGAAAAALFLAIRLSYRALRGREGLGLGDVKLAFGLGAGLGAAALPLVLLFASLIALAAALAAGWRAGRMPKGTEAVPFGAALAAAAAVLCVARSAGLIWGWA